jgi:hypothetical protein
MCLEVLFFKSNHFLEVAFKQRLVFEIAFTAGFGKQISFFLQAISYLPECDDLNGAVAEFAPEVACFIHEVKSDLFKFLLEDILAVLDSFLSLDEISYFEAKIFE